MSGKTIYMSTDEFAQKSVLKSSGLECTVDNLFFRKGDTVEHFQVKEILDACKKYNGFNINTVIVKSPKHLTVWIEDKSEKDLDSPQPQTSNVNSDKNDQGLPTKTVTKRYRGQVYEETVVDWAAVEQVQEVKPRRKYRGQYID